MKAKSKFLYVRDWIECVWTVTQKNWLFYFSIQRKLDFLLLWFYSAFQENKEKYRIFNFINTLILYSFESIWNVLEVK